jgi:two-component system NtrC family sensor kinase
VAGDDRLSGAARELRGEEAGDARREVAERPAPGLVASFFVSGARQAGLRLQIILALAGLMLLAFVPLFFAVASLAQATVAGAREQSARVLGRAIAAHVGDAHASGTPGAVARALEGHAGWDDVDAVCVFTRDGTKLACAGSPADAAAMRAPATGSAEATAVVHGATGRSLEVLSPTADLAVVTRLHLDDAGAASASLVRLVALYMVTFALALTVFAYFGLTRLIVRPVEHLVDAADRVASGARTLRVPRSGARELIDLGTSVQSMTAKLIAEEAKLLLKIDELTETTTRLTQAQAQLVRSERMASVGRLAAGVAHEIGNPIAALVGMQDLLLDGDLPPETHRDFVQRMRKETERIHTVVHGLLDFARPEQAYDAASGPPTPALVRSVVDDVVALVKPQKAFRAARVEVDIEGEPLVALPGPRLTQVLLNLVLNAGAAVASVSKEGGRVTVRARAAGDRVRIEVEDDGPGVDAGVRDRLFEPFVTTKDVGEGTGLGLAVCRGLVESAGGQIGHDATYTTGARFYVVLPSGAPRENHSAATVRER